jgi:hypothetical protein
MNVIRTRLHVAEDGTITGHAPEGVPPGDHEAEIAVRPRQQSAQATAEADLLASIHALQAEITRLPLLDARTPEEILGYNEHGLFD